MFELTKSQKKALKEITAFINKGDGIHILKGAAGTGKTTLLLKVLKHALKTLSGPIEKNDVNYVSICICSTTKKAINHARNIAVENFGNEVLELVDFRTIHSVLGMSLKVDEATGEGSLFNNAGECTEEYLKEYELVIVDEYSMMGAKVYKGLEDAIKEFGFKSLLVGDIYQLPPINEKVCQVCFKNYPESELTEIVRYSGEIIKISEKIRKGNEYIKEPFQFYNSDDGSVFLAKSEKEWFDNAAKLILSSDFRTDENFIRLLAWRRETCLKLNRKVRNVVHGKAKASKNQFLPGDALIAESDCKLGPDYVYTKLRNCEELVVISPGIERTSPDGEWKYWEVEAETIPSGNDVRTVQLNIIHWDYIKKLKNFIKAKENERNENKYNPRVYKQITNEMIEVQRLFDKVVYAYAITIHKSQGSTFNHVFINQNDIYIEKNQTKKQMLYTAITRASETLHTF